MRAVFLLAIIVSTGAVAAGQQPPAPAKSELERAVDEFKIQTRNLGLRADSPKRKGRNGAKNAWHGRIFEYFRNDFLDAVPHEIVQRGGTKGFLRRNQFGFNVAGPLVIPRLYNGGRNTFFSISYEGVQEKIARSYLRTIPTLMERTGDYSRIVDQAGELLPVFDPASTSPNPAFDPSQPVALDNLQYNRTQFPGNVIPASRLDKVAQRDLSFYPSPNSDAGPFFRNNYFINAPESNTANGVILKVDHSLAERHRLTLEGTLSNGTQGAARWFASAANPGPSDRVFSTRRGSLEHVFTVSPQTLNSFTFSVASTTNENTAEAFPVYQFSPYLQMGRSYSVARNAQNTYAYTNAFSTRKGKHSLRAIAQRAQYQVNTFWPQYPSGNYHFSAGLTSLPGIVNTGHAFASYLLGFSDYAEISIVPQPAYFRRGGWHFAFRDQYEARKGLTFSIGLSLDRYEGRKEKYDRQSTIDLSLINPANGRPGALVAANSNGWGRAFQPALWRLSPSASVTWSPRGDPKSVLRLAYSRSYSPIPVYTTHWGTQGFVGYPTFFSPNVQLIPAVVLSNGLGTLPAFPNLAPDAANDTVADLIDISERQPLYQSASFTLERELPGAMVMTFGAANSGGRNLLVGNGNANLNAIHPDYLEYRDQLNDEAFNRSLRPYPQFRGFDVYSNYPIGRYRRNAGWLRLEKRTTAGLSFSAYYEFSKQMDDYSGPYGRQDFFNSENEWSLTAGNEPQVFQFSYVYELPLGANKAFLRTSDWWRYLVDGWSVTGVGVIQAGNPIGLHPQFNNTGRVLQTVNVNVVPGVNPHVENRGPELWFNPAAFEHPDDFSMGNASRTHPSLLGPGRQNYDVTVNKRVNITPERTLELSAAGFNFINHANWTDPDEIIGTPSAPNVNAGKIIGSRGSRVIQLGLKISF
jgi:hypothetical protein